MLVSQIKTTLD